MWAQGEIPIGDGQLLKPVKQITMKNTFFLLLALLSLLAACQNSVQAELDEDGNFSESTLRVQTRAGGTSPLTYPVYIYAFSDDGAYAASTELHSEEEGSAMELCLAAGNYTIVALCGVDGYSFSDRPDMEDVVTFSDKQMAEEALMCGMAKVRVNGDASTSITLTAAVSRLEIELYAIPDDTKAVHVTVGPVYASLAMDGTYGGSTSLAIACSDAGRGVWTSPGLYVFPSADRARVSLSIALTDSKGTVSTYGYTLSEPLVANTPYELEGTFSAGFNLSGEITAEGWNDVRNIRFDLGSTTGGGNEGGGEDDTEISGTDVPAAGTLWDGHLVALSTPDDNGGATLLLLSTKEWTDVPSALNTENPSEAAGLVNTYTEGGLSGWRFPTADEAKAMRNAIGGTRLSQTNNLLSGKGLDPLSSGYEPGTKDTPVRYLCEDGEKTYVWEEGNVSKAGSSRTYRLRAVKEVTFRKQ